MTRASDIARAVASSTSDVPRVLRSSFLSIEDVAKRKGLTVDQLVQAGIAEGVARRTVGLDPLWK
jgi:hypothetical protein